jgi:membrane protein YqaA with SNARE-associated domain
VEWFERWGVLAIFIAGFAHSPALIISAGAMSMACCRLRWFGKGARFFW